MFKYTVNYEDFDGNQQSETLFFNFSKPELMKLQMKDNGKYTDHLQVVAESNNPMEIMNAFSEIILMAYGQKSEDGKRFIKSDEAREEFSQSAAYDAFLFELIGDPDIMNKFMVGVFPKDLMAQVPLPAQN